MARFPPVVVVSPSEKMGSTTTPESGGEDPVSVFTCVRPAGAAPAWTTQGGLDQGLLHGAHKGSVEAGGWTRPGKGSRRLESVEECRGHGTAVLCPPNRFSSVPRSGSGRLKGGQRGWGHSHGA